MINNSNIKFITFGCRLNSSESEVIKNYIYNTNTNINELVVFNTCAVTAEAERQARQTIRKIRREYPNAIIVVTGCATQINNDYFSNMSEINYIIDNRNKLNPMYWQSIIQKNILTATSINTTIIKDTHNSLLKTRAFVQVQNGCNYRCTFCIIPITRGNSYSIYPQDIIKYIKKLVNLNYKEVVLTGVDLASYGEDLAESINFTSMVKLILTEIPDLERLRISSIHPKGVNDELIRLIAYEPRLMPYIHLSIQSGNNIILKRMKRSYSHESIIDLCLRIHTICPDITLGADFIVGFPTETDEMFKSTIELVERCNLSLLHIFPYSIRPNTPAARMPQISNKLCKERAIILRSIGDRILKNILISKVGSTTYVLVENEMQGYSTNYFLVKFNRKCINGSIIKVHITNVLDNNLYGQVII